MSPQQASRSWHRCDFCPLAAQILSYSKAVSGTQSHQGDLAGDLALKAGLYLQVLDTKSSRKTLSVGDTLNVSTRI